MENAGAKIGDKVKVFWSNGDQIDCTVKCMPNDASDSWVVWSDDGTITHIQQYETITVLSRKAERQE